MSIPAEVPYSLDCPSSGERIVIRRGLILSYRRDGTVVVLGRVGGKA